MKPATERFRELFLTSEALPVGVIKRRMADEGFNREVIERAVRETLSMRPEPVKIIAPPSRLKLILIALLRLVGLRRPIGNGYIVPDTASGRLTLRDRVRGLYICCTMRTEKQRRLVCRPSLRPDVKNESVFGFLRRLIGSGS